MAEALKLIEAILESFDSNSSDHVEEQNTCSSHFNFRNYLAIESVGGAVFHPGTNDVVFVYNACGVYQIYETSADPNRGSKWPKRLTHSNERCTNPLFLSDGSIVFCSDVGGNEHFQMYLLIENNQSKHKLSTDSAAKHRLSFCTETHLYFVANIRDKSTFDVYRQRIPLLDHKAEIICSDLKGIVNVGTVSPFDGNLVIIQHVIANNHSNLILVDLNNNGQSSELTSKYNTQNTEKRTSVWRAIRFIDNLHILCVTDYHCDFRRPVVLNWKSQCILYIDQVESSTIWNYEYFEFNQHDEFTYFTQNDLGYSSLHRGIFEITESENAVIRNLQRIELPFQCVIAAGDSRSFTRALCLNSKYDLLAITMSNSKTPRNLYVIDLKHKMQCVQISNVSTPGVDAEHFTDSTLHSFASFDKLKIHYFRYLPTTDALKRGGKYPAMIVIHGGPESQWRPSFKALIQFYCAAGFIVIAPNVRGSTGYGRAFMDADNVEKRLDAVRDIYEMTKFVVQYHKEIDGERLVVYGGSYGGFMVLSAITEYPDIFVAAVDIVGISNFVTFLQNTADWRRALRECEYGTLKNDMETLQKISPIHKMDRVRCPLFIIQGDNDERVPLSESLQIYEKLKSRDVNVKLVRFDDEGHGVTKLKNKIAAYSQVLSWLNAIVK